MKRNKITKRIVGFLFRITFKLYDLIDMLPVYLGFQKMSYEQKEKLKRSRKNIYRLDSVRMNRYIEVRE